MNNPERPSRLGRLATSPWFGIASVLLLVAAAALWWRTSPSKTAWLCCHVRSPGVLAGPDDGRVFAYESGNSDRLVAEGKLGEDLALSPGRYDVRVVFQRLSTDRSRWLRDFRLEVNQRVVREIEFSAGELGVEATVTEASPSKQKIVVYVFRPEDHHQAVASMRAGQAVLLPRGKYDLRVVLVSASAEKEVRWLRDCEVQEGLRADHKVSFERGSILVRATNAQEELPIGAVALTAFRAGDTQEEVMDAGLAGVPLALPVGCYDVKACFTTSHDKPVQWLRGVDIRSGHDDEQAVQFSSGSIAVEARLPGGKPLAPFAAYIYYYHQGVHEQPVAYTPAGEHAVLESGTYDIRGELFRSHDRPSVWLRNVEVQAGQVITKSIEFPSGMLLVRARDDGGKELVGDNVFVYVYPKGAGLQPVATGRSGEIITLTAGFYNIRAVDTRRSLSDAWVSDIELKPGEFVEKTATFTGVEEDGPEHSGR